ncbi:hypothetical protein PVAP13_5KG175100, partial [Panicum virgatum]
MAPVRIVDVSYVAPPAKSAALPPGDVKLNAMEVQWVVLPLLQHLLFFEGNQLPPFDTVVKSLRCSLAATLSDYAPLAGKLVHLADTGDVAIRCSASDGGGVRFVVAESEADVRRLAGDEEYDVPTFERLVPEVDMTELPAPLLAVQATRLGGGGVALGVTVHHAVADGRSLWKFVRGGVGGGVPGGTPPVPPPCFDRSRVKLPLPGGEELARTVLRKYAPNLPVVRSYLGSIHRLQFIRWTFPLDAQHIERLKQRIVHLGEGAPPCRRPSSFVTAAALPWTCFVRCRSVPADKDVFLGFLADVRDRLDPPAGADYFGACLSACVAALPARELHGERALAAAAIQGAIREMLEDPVRGWDAIRVICSIPMDRLVNVSGSSSFRAYEAADFGWGRPTRTVPVTMNHDGQVALVRARDGDGVQVSVSMLRRAHMDTFKSMFL